MKNKFLLLLLLPICIFATDHCVRSSATGSDDGTTWNDAYTDLPATLTRGDTYYIADGGYSGYSFNDASTSDTIFILKATIAEHGIATSWNDTMGNGVATWTEAAAATWRISTSRWYFDGMAGSDTSGHGFKVKCESTNAQHHVVSMWSGVTANNVTFRHVDIEHRGFGLGEVGSQRGFYTNATSSDTITMQYCFIHNAIATLAAFANAPKNVLVEHCYFKNCGSANAGQHSVMMLFNGKYIDHETVVRYSKFENQLAVGGTGYMTLGGDCYLRGSDSAGGYDIYGNVFWGGTDENEGPGTFVVGTLGKDTVRHVNIYNNTVVKMNNASGFNFANANCQDINIYNNAFYNNIKNPTFGYADNKGYNAADVDLEQENDTLLVSDPFTSSTNFTLTMPISGGVVLPSPYDEDMLGETRGGDGVFDIGAYEYTGEAAPITYETCIDTSVGRGRVRIDSDSGTIMSDVGTRLRGGAFWLYGWQASKVAWAQNPAAWDSLVTNNMNSVRVSCAYRPGTGGNLAISEYETILDSIEFLADSFNIYYIICFHPTPGTMPFDDAEDFWLSIAPRYKSDLNVMYELCNEPRFSQPDDYTSADFDTIQMIWDICNDSAPSVPIIAMTFNQVGYSGRTPTQICDSMTGVDWTKTAAGFHSYWRDDTARMVDLRDNYPCINTEYGITIDGSEMKPINSDSCHARVMEKIKVSHFIWSPFSRLDLMETYWPGVLEDLNDSSLFWDADSICYVPVGEENYTVVGVDIDPRGWTVKIAYYGMDTGGTNDIGWADTLHIPDKLLNSYLLVKRQGYDSTTASRSFVTDTLWLTKVLRKNYPNDTSDSIYVAEGCAIVTYALNSYVFEDDTIKGVSIKAGLYTETEANAAYSASRATNSSTRTYSEAPVIANWMRPGRYRVIDTFTVSAFGGHMSARDRRTLKFMQFHAVDEHSNTYDTIVNWPTIDSVWMHDTLAIMEYVARIPVDGFTDGDTITVDFKAFPFFGDSLWSGDGTYSYPSPRYCSQKYYYNTGGYVAVVDSATGNDGTGAIVAEGSFSFGSPPDAYLTIGAAINGLRTSIGAADLRGQGKVYVRDGSYGLYGVTITAGTFSSFYTEIINWPDESPTMVDKAGSTSFPVNSHIKIHGFEDDHTTGSMYTSEYSIWADSCTFYNAGGSIIYDNTIDYFTNCYSDPVDLNIPYSAVDHVAGIVRSCRLGGDDNDLVPYVFAGCTNTNLTGMSIREGNTTVPCPDGAMFISNIFTKNDEFFIFGDDTSYTHGILFVNNVFEKTANTSPLMRVAGDASMSLKTNNMIFFGNVLVGERFNHGYNDTQLNDSLNIRWREFWSMKWNIFHRIATVTDNDFHGDVPGSPRNGNWSLTYGVNFADNIICNAVAGVADEFWGLNVYWPNAAWDQTGEINDTILFVDDNSWTGSADGWGDYHLQATSPAVNFGQWPVLLYDLDGNARGSDSGSIGTYIYSEEVEPDSFSIHTYLDGTGSGSVTTIPVGGKVAAGEPCSAYVSYDAANVLQGWEGDTTATTDTIAWAAMDENKTVIAVVNLITAPTIVVDPVYDADSLGEEIDFVIVAVGDPDITYQWNRIELNGDTTELTGETSTSLVFTGTILLDSTYYYCVAENAGGADSSTAAMADVIWTVTIDESGGIVATVQRDDSLNVARPEDRVHISGGNYGTQGDSSAVYINSTGSLRGEIFSWTDTDIYYDVPAGSPRGYYRTRVRRADMIISPIPDSYNFYIKVAYRPEE